MSSIEIVKKLVRPTHPQPITLPPLHPTIKSNIAKQLRSIQAFIHIDNSTRLFSLHNFPFPILCFQLKQFKEEKRREEKALGVEEESEEIRKIKKVKTRV